MSAVLNPEPAWARYSFAVAAAATGLVLELWIHRLLTDPITPFLPAFAAVIASASWAGFGPGLTTTVISTGWCAWLLYGSGQHSAAAVITRCSMFAMEGLLLSIGSARMRSATRDIARSEDWHRKLLETSAEGIWVVDAAGFVSYANPRIAEMLGLTVDDLEGHRAEEFFLPEDLSMERIRFRNRRIGQKEQFDRRVRRRDGSELWVLTSANSFPGKNGEVGVLSMMTDITERKKAEHALRRSEERFRSLFENVLEGVYQSTPDGRVLAANPMLLRMLGLTSEAQLNDVDIARDLYVDAGVRKRLLERLERDGSFQNVEYELRCRDGGIITVQENARVVRDEEGAVLYYEGTLSDVTERKRMEEQLRQALHQQLHA